MELHNALNKLKTFYNDRSYLLDNLESYKKAKEFTLINNLKNTFQTCKETEDIICDYLYVVNTDCASIKTSSCDYIVTNIITSYNVSTQILSGYIIFSGNLYLEKTKLFINISNTDIAVIPTISYHAPGLQRLNFSIPIGILNYFNVSYSIAWKLISDKCYQQALIQKLVGIDIARNINKTTLTGLLTDAPLLFVGVFPGPYNSRLIVEVPYTVTNPSNIPWEIKNTIVTINGVTKTATAQLLHNDNHANGPVSYVRLTIPYAENETVPNNPMCEYTINIGYVGNSTVLDNMTQVITINTNSIFYGYDFIL